MSLIETKGSSRFMPGGCVVMGVEELWGRWRTALSKRGPLVSF